MLDPQLERLVAPFVDELARLRLTDGRQRGLGRGRERGGQKTEGYLEELEGERTQSEAPGRRARKSIVRETASGCQRGDWKDKGRRPEGAGPECEREGSAYDAVSVSRNQ